jgi:very-short-patch-repair endonuclease
VGVGEKKENTALDFTEKLPRFYETAPKGAHLTHSLLWAEAKKGKSNIYTSFVQLILTIGKARTFDKELPPAYLGAFDAYQMTFIPYNEIQEIFYQNDFNWNVTPSNYETKEFKQIHNKVEQILTSQSLIFAYETDQKELKEFIKTNFVAGKSETSKIQIDKNNFIIIYNKWLKEVKPSIGANWETAKKHGIIDGDFYLADLLSSENQTLKEKLYVLLNGDYYELDKKLDDMGMFSSRRTNFYNNQKAHTQFWNRYLRPPKSEYWDYIVERRDLLVPQDVRERKGSFFTPQIWVEKSQEYLTAVLGENWQDEYYIWDCAAGTGNLLTGLTNKYNIYASSLDRQDVDVMRERIQTMNQNSVSGNGANLLESHVFQFDFLNDSFEDEKVPQSLREILKDPEKRKKLVIYINPPYAETMSYGEKDKKGLSDTKVNEKYKDKLTTASNRELFVQFLTRIYFEISGCIIGEFSTIKVLQSPNFKGVRKFFLAKLEKAFLVPADTFDNVKGQFPISFKVWNTDKKEKFIENKVDVFDKKGEFEGEKSFYSYDNTKDRINDWLRVFQDKNSEIIGIIHNQGTDFQQSKLVRFTSDDDKNHTANITQKNLIPMSIYLAVRHVFKATWLNDRDQFLFPNDGWKTDTEFQNDCLAFSLFHGQNRISSKIPLLRGGDEVGGVDTVAQTKSTSPSFQSGTPQRGEYAPTINHWIPFTETEVNAPERFESRFMVDFIGGRLGTKEIPLIDGWQPQVDGVDITERTKSTSPAIAGTPQEENLDGIATLSKWKQNSLFPFWNLPKNNDLESNAKKLRKAGVLSEVLFWQAFKNKKVVGFDIDRQVTIGNYIVDFFIPEIGLVIEIDGESHDFKGEYDVVRENYLQSLGLEIIHYKDIEIKKSMDFVSDSFLASVKKREGWLKENPPHLYEAPLNEGNLSDQHSEGENLGDTNELFTSTQESFIPTEPLQFSPEAQAVFEAGKELWKYYFENIGDKKSTPSSLRDTTPQEGNLGKSKNPSLYDIKSYFQGADENGRMNNKSNDEKYNLLIANLRESLEVLSHKIQPKVYEFGFLK